MTDNNVAPSITTWAGAIIAGAGAMSLTEWLAVLGFALALAGFTPEAGTMKAGHYRDVPLHRQVVEQGFVRFVEEAGQGPLFHNGQDPEKYAAKAQRMSNQIADWLRLNEIKPDGVQPSHAWRHRFKTQARDIGVDSRVVDAIQGHASRTASDDYGDVSLIAKARVIDALPEYRLQ